MKSEAVVHWSRAPLLITAETGWALRGETARKDAILHHIPLSTPLGLTNSLKKVYCEEEEIQGTLVQFTSLQ